MNVRHVEGKLALRQHSIIVLITDCVNKPQTNSGVDEFVDRDEAAYSALRLFTPLLEDE